MADQHTVRAIVKGEPPFPTDMLRYDSCYPASEDDSFVIDRASPHVETHGRRFTVTVERIEHGRIRRGFTVARWESFGWSCEEVE